MTEIIGDDERLEGCSFIPRAGDHVEFLSDKQTEKGPSSGTVLSVNRDKLTAVIRHSDHSGEQFNWSDVKVAYFIPGKSLWVLK